MKEVEFKDYSAKYQDADGDEHTSTVSAHVATKESAEILGTVLSHAGPHVVKNGDVLVKTERPDFYDVHSSKTWDEIGYKEGDGKSTPLVSDSSEESDESESPSRTPRKTTR